MVTFFRSTSHFFDPIAFLRTIHFDEMAPIDDARTWHTHNPVPYEPFKACIEKDRKRRSASEGTLQQRL
jgi:hypothetical protein